MKKSSLVVALPALVLSGLLLSGCGMLRSHKAWDTARQESPLEIPPGLDTPAANDALVIPPPGANNPTSAGVTADVGGAGGMIADGSCWPTARTTPIAASARCWAAWARSPRTTTVRTATR